MKIVTKIMCGILIAGMLTSCVAAPTSGSQEQAFPSTFVVVAEDVIGRCALSTVYDKHTNLMYVVTYSVYSSAGGTTITRLENKEGKPLSYDEWKNGN